MSKTLTGGEMHKILRRRDDKIKWNKELLGWTVAGLLLLSVILLSMTVYNLKKTKDLKPENDRIQLQEEQQRVEGAQQTAPTVLPADDEAAFLLIEKPDKTLWLSINPKPGPENQAQIQAVLEKVCRANEIAEEETERCWKTLYAMSQQESVLFLKPTGDQGRSIGWFHIQVKKHGITRDCANNLGCSADWTLKHLKANGYPERYEYAVQSHNGWGTKAAKRLEYAQKIIAKVIALK